MDLTPSDVRNHSFSRSLRGFDAEEVKAYLESIADKIAAVSGEREELKTRIESLEKKVERYGAVARVLDETIDDTSRSTEELVQDVKAKLNAADEDAKEVARNAEEQAHAIRRKTAQLHEQIRDQADAVTQERRDLARRQEKLMGIAAQLTEVMGGEIKSKPTPSNDGAAAQTSTPPTLYSGGTPGPAADTPQKSEPAETPKEKKKKTKQEWIDSLFPNRLGAGDTPQRQEAPQNKEGSQQPSEESREPAEGQKSSGSSHFEAIKQDVQNQGGGGPRKPSGTSSDASEDEDGPSTNELERIWDIFDQTQ